MKLQKNRDQIAEIEMYHASIQKLKSHELAPFTNSEKFDEALFNSELESRAQKVEELTALVEDLINTGTPEYMLEASHIISEAYLDLSTKILSFSPQGVDIEFADSFKAAMRPLAQGLEQKGRDYFLNTKDNLLKNKVLGAKNYLINNEEISTQNLDYTYMASHQGFLMDQKSTGIKRVGQVQSKDNL